MCVYVILRISVSGSMITGPEVEALGNDISLSYSVHHLRCQPCKTKHGIEKNALAEAWTGIGVELLFGQPT